MAARLHTLRHKRFRKSRQSPTSSLPLVYPSRLPVRGAAYLSPRRRGVIHHALPCPALHGFQSLHGCFARVGASLHPHMDAAGRAEEGQAGGACQAQGHRDGATSSIASEGVSREQPTRQGRVHREQAVIARRGGVSPCRKLTIEHCSTKKFAPTGNRIRRLRVIKRAMAILCQQPGCSGIRRRCRECEA